ncbi:KamA family radical SAM protein [Desulfocurvus sp. DL9XJH121]
MTELMAAPEAEEHEEQPPSRSIFGGGPINRAVQDYRDAFFPGLADKDWNDWRWQLRHRLTNLPAFAGLVKLTTGEVNAPAWDGTGMPAAMTPYYAALIWNEAREGRSSLRRCMVPHMDEACIAPYETCDSLGEEHDSPVPGLVHRYPDRVLFLATNFCSSYCRYCTRSRRVGRPESKRRLTATWDKAVDYVREHPEVRDVLVSGGDPLTMSNAALEYILSRLTAIPHVEMVRIGTKAPMVLPQRITPSLVRMLRRFRPLYVSIHCTHPSELTPEAALACNRLADAGIPLGSQTVLLNGVNDDRDTLMALFRGLLTMRVRPYYLYHCDQVAGTSHFRTTLGKGLDIMRGIRGYTTGYALPQYVVDLPGGGGKVPVCPEYFTGRQGSTLLFKNYEGREFAIHDPEPMEAK